MIATDVFQGLSYQFVQVLYVPCFIFHYIHKRHYHIYWTLLNINSRRIKYVKSRCHCYMQHGYSIDHFGMKRAQSNNVYRKNNLLVASANQHSEETPTLLMIFKKSKNFSMTKNWKVSEELCTFLKSSFFHTYQEVKGILLESMELIFIQVIESKTFLI